MASCSSSQCFKVLFALSLLVIGSLADTHVNARIVDSSYVASLSEIDSNEELPASSGLDHGQRQLEWIRSKGGFVNKNFGIRKLEPLNPKSTYEVYAKGDMAKNDVILVIPRACIISSFPKEKSGDALECETARNLYREMQLGNKSQYEPYITYLKETQEYGQLPSMYSEAGKKWMWKIVGGTSEQNQVLPPFGPTDWIEYEWEKGCKGGSSKEQQHAALLVVQRSWDDLLIPVFDMMSHRNGYWLNTDSNTVHKPDEDVTVRATRDIRAGEVIYTSYDSCRDCSARAKTYGTAEIVRDYGFVEQFPQKWIFHDQEIGFKLHEVEGEEDLQLEWILEEADEDEMDFFEDQIERLEKLDMTTRPDDVPEREWNVLFGYRQALVTAMKRLIEVVSQDEEDRENGTCSFVKGTCGASKYDPLTEYTPEVKFNLEACNRKITLNFSKFDVLDTIESPYQVITYMMNPKDRDICFDLDDIIQICGDYRPHYHEMVVHYTARFLDKIERVLWVGGGDSMLLYEILKYPSVKLAIGLELDQKVTRYSFKHFGSQPHWDNEKVQWWYGDAAKSMLMIPKELYGTFDLVLVDLSETVMSMTVTKGLDIMAALSLLLKPDGIFVKNEMYLEKMSDLFKHTVQVHYYDVPRLCSQCLCFGSNTIDFVHKPLVEHNVDPMLNPLKEIDGSHYQIYNDYVLNPSSQTHCLSAVDSEEPKEQESSPGIVMILEAEDVQLDLQPSILQSAIRAAVDKEGLGVVAVLTSNDETRTVVVLREGYIVSRTLAEKKYCAFDIHLWGSFAKLESVKASLVSAVQTKNLSSSSFRIVAGGMFGVSTWKEDEMSRGPKFTQECQGSPSVKREVTMDGKVVNTIVEETLEILPWENVVAVVLCGSNGKPCDTIYPVAKDRRVSKIITLRACPDIDGDIQFLQDGEKRTRSCEKEIVSELEENLRNEKIGLVVLDPSAPLALAQIFERICSRTSKRKLFARDQMVLAPVLDIQETWRNVFLDRFALDFYRYPSFRSAVLFNSTDSTVEMGTFLSGSKDFVLALDDVNIKVENRTGLVAEIRDIHQGAPDYQKDFVPSQYFMPDDYDQRGPLDQWESQRPWGLQTILQINVTGEFSRDEAKAQLGRAISLVGAKASITEFTQLGEGSLLFATWSKGDVVVVFDGRKTVTINLFTLKEDVKFASKFAAHFTKGKDLEVGLRDEMPRGYGRVVNFLSDLKPRETPHWALHLEVKSPK